MTKKLKIKIKTETRKTKKTEKVETPKDTLSLHVLYSQTCTSGETKCGYTSRSDQHTTTTFKGVSVGKCDPQSRYQSQIFEIPKEAFAVPRSHVYAVVGYYSDGDSFGTSHDNMHIVDVYGNMNKAQAIARSLEAEEPDSIFGANMHVPWGGYFSRLDRIEIEVLPVVGVDMNYTDLQNPDDIPSW